MQSFGFFNIRCDYFWLLKKIALLLPLCIFGYSFLRGDLYSEMKQQFCIRHSVVMHCCPLSSIGSVCTRSPATTDSKWHDSTSYVRNTYYTYKWKGKATNRNWSLIWTVSSVYKHWWFALKSHSCYKIKIKKNQKEFQKQRSTYFIRAPSLNSDRYFALKKTKTTQLLHCS